MRFYNEMVPELQRLELGPPVAFAYSILKAKSGELGINRMWGLVDAEAGTFDRDVVPLPDVVLQEFPQAHVALRPMFDLVWQASGIPKSWNYDEQGNWVQR